MRNKLTDRKLRTKETGRLFDGGGLHLYTRQRASGALTKQWVFRFTLDGKRSDMGLGTYPEVTLERARELARDCETLVSEGHDPRQKRDEARSKAMAEARNAEANTLKEMADRAFEAKRASLKEGGRTGHWMTPLRLYVLPDLGHLPITEIRQEQIVTTFQSIWHDKYPSAKKALNRLNITYEYAEALGIDVDPRIIKRARHVLGESEHEEVGYGSVPYPMAPDYYNQLEPRGSGLIIKATMLTAVRGAEMRFARVEDVDWNNATLLARKETVKGVKKRLKDHIIPLSSEGLRIARMAAGDRSEGILFPSPRGKVFSNNLSKAVRESAWLKQREIHATLHGMRSTFKTFMLERHPEVPPHIVEHVLSHKVENDVAQAYTRTQLVDQQRCALERWGRFLAKDKTPIMDRFSPDGIIGGAK